MDCDTTEKGIIHVKCKRSWAPLSCQRWRRGQVDRILVLRKHPFFLFRARFSRSNMLLSLALLLGISTAISSLPQPWFGLFFWIFVIIDCFDLIIFQYTVKSIYTLTSTFWSWDLPPRIENRTNKKHCHLLSSSTMVWSYSANIVITNQEAIESIKNISSIFMMPVHLIFVTTTGWGPRYWG